MTEPALRFRAHDSATCPRFRDHVEGLVTGATVGSSLSSTPSW